MDNGKLLLTERQAFERLSVGRSTFRKLMDRGEIRPLRIGRSIRFDVSELERFVNKLRVESKDPAGER